MNLTLSIALLVSLVAGTVILAAPRLLNYIVAIYLIGHRPARTLKRWHKEQLREYRG
jgi:hypothetical protein